MARIWVAARLLARGNFLAVLGLCLTTLLSLPGLPDWVRALLDAGLVAIWAIYAAQLAIILREPLGEELRLRPLRLAVDLLAVIVPPMGLFWPDGQPGPGLFCLIWVLKLLREMAAFRLVMRVLGNEARNIFGVLSIFGIILFLASALGYLFERDSQPQTFGSILQTMWWGVRDALFEACNRSGMVAISQASITTERFGQFRLAEDGNKSFRDGHTRVEPAVLLFPVTPLRSHRNTSFWHQEWH